MSLKCSLSITAMFDHNLRQTDGKFTLAGILSFSGIPVEHFLYVTQINGHIFIPSVLGANKIS